MTNGFGLLRERDFRQLFLADTISQLGTQVSMLALPLIAVLALHASSFEVGLLAACESAAFLLIGLPAGAWVDRWRRRRVLIIGDLGRAVLLGSIPLAWALGWLTIAQLVVVALLVGGCTVFFDVAYQSYLPHLVGRGRLIEGNAKLESVRAASQIGGPTMAGFLIQVLGAPVAVIIDAVSYLGSALFVTGIRKREELPEISPGRHLGQEIKEGLRFVLGNRMLRSIAMCTGSSNLFSAIIGAMQVVLLARVLALSPGMIGLVYTVAAVGGLTAAFTGRRVAQWLGQGPTIWLAPAIGGPFALILPMAQRGVLLWLAAIGAGIWWYCAVVYNIAQVSFRQGLCPERLLGRMNATMRFLVWGTMPLGGLLGGVLGQNLGVRPAMWIGAIGGLFSFLPVLLSPLRGMRELPKHDDHAEPARPVQPAGV